MTRWRSHTQMSAFEQLPPDQRATLSLLLRRHKSYAEVAEMLEIEPGAVHDRAHAALAVLAPSLARQLTPELRDAVGEYLLGQQQPAEALLTRSRLVSSAPARAWAKALAVELVHAAADQLPEIPEPAQTPPTPAPAGEPAADREPEPSEPSRARVSRRGGFALLGAIAVVAIVAIVAVVSSGKGAGSGGGKQVATQAKESSSTSETESTSTTSASSTASLHAETEFVLTAPAGGKATGGVEFASENGKRGFIIAAEHLEPPKGFEYVAWLLNSKGEAHALGIAAVSKAGKLYAGNELPKNVSSYDVFELTRDTGPKPAKPGQVALEGTFKLG